MNVPRNKKLFGVSALWYGMGAGVNSFQHHDTMFVYGTFLMPESFYTPIWNRYYQEEYGEMPRLTYELDEVVRTWLPTNPQLRMLYNAFVMPIVYNLIHRVRMTRSPTDLYYYGWNLPEPLQREMDVIFE